MLQLSMWQSCGSMSMQYRWLYRGCVFDCRMLIVVIWLWPWIILCFLKCMLISPNGYSVSIEVRSRRFFLFIS